MLEFEASDSTIERDLLNSGLPAQQDPALLVQLAVPVQALLQLEAQDHSFIRLQL